MTRTTTLLYLHGFLSSPKSLKAQLTCDYCNQTQCVDKVLVPTLQWGPQAAISQLHELMQKEDPQRVVVIGSSLGGFYATIMAQHYGMPAALVNPAVGPFDRWDTYLGEHRNYYEDTVHTVSPRHVAELESLNKAGCQNPENFLLLVETGDETLDYRKAVEKYAKSAQIVHHGGSHSYENYRTDLPAIFSFLLSRIA